MHVCCTVYCCAAAPRLLGLIWVGIVICSLAFLLVNGSIEVGVLGKTRSGLVGGASVYGLMVTEGDKTTDIVQCFGRAFHDLGCFLCYFCAWFVLQKLPLVLQIFGSI